MKTQKVVNQNYVLNQKKFGARLRELREEKGYTQQEIADKLGLKSGNSISSYEQGRTFPREENLYTLSRLYCTSLDYLLGRDERKAELFRNEVVELTTTSPDKKLVDKEAIIIEADLSEDQVNLIQGIINQLTNPEKQTELNGLGCRLRRLRMINEASINEISELSGVNPGSLYDMERGKGMPSAKSLIALAKLYNVSTDYILGLEAEKSTCDTSELNFHQKKLIENLIESFRESNRGGANFKYV